MEISLNTVDVSLRTASRWERFDTAAKLLRRLHEMGAARPTRLEVCEKGIVWPEADCRALLLKLLSEKGLTFFRRNRHLTVSRHTWEQLKAIVGVRNEQPANQIPAGIAGEKKSRGDCRFSFAGDQRPFSKRIGEAGFPRVLPSAQGAALQSPRQP